MSSTPDYADLAFVCRWDPARTARFGLVGLTLHGPSFFMGFRAVEGFFGKGTDMTLVRTDGICTICRYFDQAINASVSSCVILLQIISDMCSSSEPEHRHIAKFVAGSMLQ